VPRVSIQAFCESQDLAAVVSEAMSDRRMDRSHVKVHMGGAAAAVEAYRSAPTPNLIIIESSANRGDLLGFLETLAESCIQARKWSSSATSMISCFIASSWRRASATTLSLL
jgi:pilus assembly protein CpaE